jgi:hypothetical protein
MIKFYALSQRSNFWMVVIYFILAWYPLHEYTQIRVAVALSFSFLALVFLGHGRLRAAFALGVGSVLFHSSLVVLVPFIIAGYTLRRWPIWISIAAMIFLAFFLKAIFWVAAFSLGKISGNALAYFDFSAGAGIEYFSIAHLLMLAALLSALLSDGFSRIETRLSFLITVASFPLMIAFSDNPVIGLRLKELFMSFSVLFVFQRALIWRAVPQMIFGFLFSLSSAYTYVASGSFW